MGVLLLLQFDMALPAAFRQRLRPVRPAARTTNANGWRIGNKLSSLRMKNQFGIECLRSFAAIAESGVMSRAAERVGRTQAALSQQMKKLETTIQQPLMIRTSRGVKLTSQGERLLAHAQKILRAHDEAVGELLGVRLLGNVRFGCPDDYARVFLPPLLQGFAHQHPQVLVEVVCAPTPRLLEKLGAGMLDIAIISLPESTPKGQILRREPFVWVGARGGDAHKSNPLQLALSDPDTLDHQAATQSLEKAGRRYRIAYASGSMTGLAAVVRSGQAITVLTRTAVPPDLQELPRSAGLPRLPSVGITVRSAPRSSSAVLGHFEAHIRKVLPTL
jgi:DNA-binding transcriptional LysR family regulator